MANDPYWNNTVLLLHGDITGDPNWESVVLADGFTSDAATVPATAWNDPYGTIGQYFGKQALYCQGTYRTMYNTGSSSSVAFTVELDYYITGFTQNTNAIFQSCTHQVSPYNTTPHLALWTNIGGALGGNFHGTVVQGITTLQANRWYHISVSFNGTNTVYIHIDGALVYSAAMAASASDIDFILSYIGYGPNSNRAGVGHYFANLRVYRGAQLYNAANYTPTVRPLYGAVPDSSSKVGRRPTGTGSTRTPYTADYKYGGASLFFDGNSTVTLDGSGDFAFGTGDWTVEGWIKLLSTPSGTQSVFSGLPLGADGYYIGVSVATGPTKLRLELGYAGSILSSDSMPINQWVHFAGCKSSGQVRFYQNGVSVGAKADSSNFSIGANRPIFGMWGYSAIQKFTGLLDDVRFTKGVARYTAAFTPPAQAHPEGLTTVSGVITDITGAPCARRVNVHSQSTGRLLGTAVSDAVTGAYSIGAPEQCYVVVLDTTGDYDALVLDRIDPVS